MITITFHRKSVCMGDDASNGEYTIQMPDIAFLGDLMHVILCGGSGNDWPIPYTGANSFWIIKSNIGNLAKIFTDQEGEWHTVYLSFTEKTPLQSLGITWMFGDRVEKGPVDNSYKKTCMTGKEIKEYLSDVYGRVRPYNDSFFKVTDAETGSGVNRITYTKEKPEQTI